MNESVALIFQEVADSAKLILADCMAAGAVAARKLADMLDERAARIRATVVRHLNECIDNVDVEL